MKLILFILLTATTAFAQITYPISTNDFFSFRLGTGAWTRNGKWPRADGQPLSGTNVNLQILREVNAALPAYTNTSHKLDNGTWLHNTNANTLTATFTYAPVVLTAVESNQISKRLVLSNAVTTLRTWSSQAAGTTVTSNNVVSVTQTTITRLGIFFANFADLLEVQRLNQ